MPRLQPSARLGPSGASHFPKMLDIGRATDPHLDPDSKQQPRTLALDEALTPKRLQMFFEMTTTDVFKIGRLALCSAVSWRKQTTRLLRPPRTFHLAKTMFEAPPAPRTLLGHQLVEAHHHGVCEHEQAGGHLWGLTLRGWGRVLLTEIPLPRTARRGTVSTFNKRISSNISN